MSLFSALERVGRTAARGSARPARAVSVIDRYNVHLRELGKSFFSGGISTALGDAYTIEQTVRDADVVIGAVLLKGEKHRTW